MGQTPPRKALELMARKAALASSLPAETSGDAAAAAQPSDASDAAAAAPPVADTTATTPAADATQTTPPAEAPAEPSVVDLFKQKGFEGVSDEKTAAQRALEAWEQQKAELERLRQEYEQTKPYVEYGRRYLESAHTQPPPAEKEPETPQGWWSPPEVNLSLVRHWQETKLDPATNEIVTTWKPNAPQDLKAAYDARLLYQEQWTQKFVENPREALEPFRQEILQEARALIDQQYTAKYQEQSVSEFLSSFEQEHADWLFVKDPVTQKPRLDQLTPEAEQYFREAREEFRLADPELICKYALRQRELARATSAAQQASTTAQAAQVADQKRREILARNSAGAPNRSGTTPPPEAKGGQQNRNLSLRQKLQQAFVEDGVTV